MKMKEDGCPWEEIYVALTSHTTEAIQAHYSTKHGGGQGARKR